MSNQQKKDNKPTPKSCRVKEKEIVTPHIQTDTWRRWQWFFFFRPLHNETAKGQREMFQNLCGIRSIWTLAWKTRLDAEKRECERLKRAAVASAPAAPRRGVTLEIGDGITQLPRLLARSGDKGRGREELMKGREGSGLLGASRHLPGELPPPSLLIINMDLALSQITDWLECFKSVFALMVPLRPVALMLSEVSLWGPTQHSDSQQVSRWLSPHRRRRDGFGSGCWVPHRDSSVKCYKVKISNLQLMATF